MGVISCCGSQIPRPSGQPLGLETSEHVHLAHGRRDRRERGGKSGLRCHCGKSVLRNDGCILPYLYLVHTFLVCLFVCLFRLKLLWVGILVTYTRNSDTHGWGMNLWGTDWSGGRCLLSFLCIQYLKSTDVCRAGARLTFPFCMIEEGPQEQLHLVREMMKLPHRKGWSNGI